MKYKYVYLIQIWVNFLCIRRRTAGTAKKNWTKNIKLFFFDTLGERNIYYYLIFAAFDVANSCQSHLSAHNATAKRKHTHTQRQFACYKALHILRRTAAASTQNINKNRNKKCIWQFLPCIFHNSQLSHGKKHETKVLKITNIFPMWTCFWYTFCN